MIDSNILKASEILGLVKDVHDAASLDGSNGID